MMNSLRNSIIIILLSFPAFAFVAEEKLSDPKKEEAAQELFHQLRCLVCEGESLADSSADLAHDMRALIRKELAAGKSPEEIKGRLTTVYGQQILQSPPLGAQTYFLWFMPFAVIIIGAICLLRRKPKKV